MKLAYMRLRPVIKYFKRKTKNNELLELSFFLANVAIINDNIFTKASSSEIQQISQFGQIPEQEFPTNVCSGNGKLNEICCCCKDKTEQRTRSIEPKTVTPPLATDAGCWYK